MISRVTVFILVAGFAAQMFFAAEPVSGDLTAALAPSIAEAGLSTIDVLVVYTPFAKARNGGAAGVESIISSSIDLTNTVFTNSGIPARLRLVHVQEVNYGEGPQPSNEELNWVQRDETVAKLRRDHNADLVVLVTERSVGGSGGIAAGLLKRNLGSLHAQFSASVVAASVSAQSLVFAHEIGHNLAAHHALGDNAPAENLMAVRNAHGLTIPEKGMMTVMAQGCATCTVRPYFSNPAVLFEGAPTGIAGIADNSRAIRFAAPIAASYRNAVGPAGMLELEHDPVVAERGTSAIFRVLREKGSRGNVSVDYRTIVLEGEAQSGIDFQDVSGTLTWPEGDSRPREIIVPIPMGSSGEKLAAVQLSNPTGEAVLFRGGLAMLTIADATQPGARGVIEFATGSQVVREGDNLMVTLRRRGGSEGGTGVTLSTIEGSADRTDDFQQHVSFVTWATGDASDLTISIPIYGDELREGDETFLLRLSGEPGLLGRQRSSSVTILDTPLPRRRGARR